VGFYARIIKFGNGIKKVNDGCLDRFFIRRLLSIAA